MKGFDRILSPLRRKLFLMIGRGILEAVNNEGRVGYYASGTRKNPQRVQIEVLSNEILTDIERFQEFGFESYPIGGDTAEALVFSMDGERDNTVVFGVQDITYRPTDLSSGEVCLYSLNDKDNSHRIHLKTDGSIEIYVTSGGKFSIENDSDDVIALLVDTITELKGLITELKGITVASAKIETIGDVNPAGGFNAATISNFTTMESTVDGLKTDLEAFKK